MPSQPPKQTEEYGFGVRNSAEVSVPITLRYCGWSAAGARDPPYLSGSLVQASPLAKRPGKNDVFGWAVPCSPRIRQPGGPRPWLDPRDGDHRRGQFVRAAATVDPV